MHPANESHRSTLRTYVISFIAIALVLWIRWWLSPALRDLSPYRTLFAAVAFIVWYGGWRPAAIAAIVGFLAANFFIGHLGFVINRVELFEFISYILTSAVIIFFGDALHRSVKRLRRESEDRRYAEDAERRQKELLRVTLASIGDGVVVCDAAGRVSGLNAEASRLTGWTEAEAVNRPLTDVFQVVNESTGERVEDPVTRVLLQGVVVGLANHTLLISRDGTRTPIGDSAAPIRENGGQVLGVVLVFRDMTEERAAQRASAQLAAIVQYSGEAIATKNLDGIVQTWNASAQKLFGYTAEEIVGKPITMLLPQDRLHEETEILARLRGGQTVERFETIRVTRDGRHIPVAVSISPIRDDEGRVVGASKVVHDISEVVSAREALAQEHKLLATTLASIGDAVITADADAKITYVNAVAEKVTGWCRDEAIGRSLDEVFLIVNEVTGEPVENPATIAMRDGVIMGLANHSVLIRRDGGECAIDDSAAPIRDSDGSVVGCVLVFRDITERRREAKRAEDEINRLFASERNARAEVEQTNRLKDEFLATLSHELRTPLNAILGFSQLIERNPGDVKGVKEGIQVITRNAKIQVDLISDLLDMSRIISGKLRLDVADMDLVEIINAGIDAIRHSAEARMIQIETDLPRGRVVARGDAGRLQQVVWNLLSNAVKFTPKRGTIRVKLAFNKANATITVEDTGMGIRPEILPHLFERFRQGDSSIAREHAGLGLGLAIVKHLVELHGGSVRAESPGPGQGAAFAVELPLAGGQGQAAPVDVKSTPGHAAAPEVDDDIDLAGLKVLAIDDQEDSRAFLARVLEEHHARVINTASAEEGLWAYKKYKPDIILCDIGMPGVDGYQFIRQMREGGNQTPALAVTAFARGEDRIRALRAGYQGHITKPVNPSELLATIAVFVGKRAS